MTVSKVKRTIERYRMLEPGDRVVVAVSGGPDSVFLLHALAEARDPVIVLAATVQEVDEVAGPAPRGVVHDVDDGAAG